MTKNVVLDPRQSLAIAHYKDPSGDTFGNLKQSCIKAGFGEGYSDSIHGKKPKWITQSIEGTVKAIKQSEKNMQKYNEMDVNIDKPTKADIEKMKIQLDVSKFNLKTLGKAKYDAQGEELDRNVTINITNYNEADNKPKAIDVTPE